MTKKTALFLILVIFPPMLFAGYDENLAAGLAAYKQNKLVEAYKYYYAAYREKPSPKLQQVLQFITKKYRAGAAAAPAIKPAPQKDTPWKWVLLAADAAALGFTVYAGAGYFSQADKYDKLYAQKDNTTMDNYNLLLSEDRIFHDKEGVYGAGIVLTSLAVAYTLADALFIHAVFPVTLAASFDPAAGGVMLALNFKY